MGRVVTAIVVAALGGCSPSAGRSSAEGRPGEPEAGRVEIVVGNRYDKSSYVDDAGRTVLSFNLSVRNAGDAGGRSGAPSCYTVVGDIRHDLQIYENPDLAPGEQGWLRAGGPVLRLRPAEIDNVEPYCDL